MQIALQDTSLDINEFNKSAETLASLNYLPKTFGIIPFTNHISIDSELESPTIMLGGTKLVKLWLNNCVPKNAIIFYDKQKFDQAYYHQYLKEELLNETASFVLWGSLKNKVLSKPIFIKPSSDLKYFGGLTLYPHNDDIISNLISNEKLIDIDLNDDITMLINYNILTKILKEFRVFVVNNQIVDISQYIDNGKVVPSIVEDKTSIIEYVKKIQKLYEPHSHYVIDICLYDNKFKVVEYNCINCSGMYAIDRVKLFQEFFKL